METDIFIACHYWEPKFPKLFYPNQIDEFKKLKIIGDITCDINGSIPTTLRSSTITDPYYYFDRTQLKETDKNKNALAVMAVDNLPSELPRDSSKEFGDGIVKEVIPFIIEKDDGRIDNATITKQGVFCPKYDFLNYFIKD